MGAQAGEPACLRVTADGIDRLSEHGSAEGDPPGQCADEHHA